MLWVSKLNCFSSLGEVRILPAWHSDFSGNDPCPFLAVLVPCPALSQSYHKCVHAEYRSETSQVDVHPGTQIPRISAFQLS